MSQLLERAIDELRKLPAPEQDAIAARILEEIADERAWDEAFARSQDGLAQLAERAREQIAARRTRALRSREP